MIVRLMLAAAILLAAASLVIHSQYSGRFPATRNECVILMHGLCRSALSMKMIENHLKQNGYAAVNSEMIAGILCFQKYYPEEMMAK